MVDNIKVKVSGKFEKLLGKSHQGMFLLYPHKAENLCNKFRFLYMNMSKH